MCYNYFPKNFSSYEEYIKYLKEQGLAIEAPEKIVLQEPTKVRTERLYDNDIEYVQTDAFIEKACEWLKNDMLQQNAFQGRLERLKIIDGIIEGFRKAMEE